MAIPGGPLYTASKHAILGIMRSLHFPLELQGIRIGVIHPFFAGAIAFKAHIDMYIVQH